MITLSVRESGLEVHLLSRKGMEAIELNAAVEVQQVEKAHLQALPGQSFYDEAALSIEREKKAKQQTVSIYKTGIALQYFGGTVEAGKGESSATGRPTKFLTIPKRRGLQAAGFYKGQLTFVKTRKPSVAFLVEKESAKTGKWDIWFTLVKKATIKPHPYILPTPDALVEAAAEGANTQLRYLQLTGQI